ncbi:hypothetical protein ABZV58_03295 [Nocardia sp. NPDC004654]|uniref:hypothetical protein n=1 Tax=Nocardia sp. NPDC004654 TaxID=3154776 RepID=UPI0033AAB22A
MSKENWLKSTRLELVQVRLIRGALPNRKIFFEVESRVELEKSIAELDRQQIDHAHDLQLGGKDQHQNMWAIDAATNHGMGGQINSQLARVLDGGARIKIHIIR